MGFERWKGWCLRSTNRRIFGAIISIGGFTILVKLAAIAKQLVIAGRFGTGDALDAFLIAFLAPSFAINVAAGSFSAALIPTFVEVREREGQDAAQRLFSSVMVLSIFLILAISGILAAFSPTIIRIIGSGFSPEKQALTRSLFFIALPLLIISGLAAIWASILNAQERFALAAIAPVITPVAAVIAILLLGRVWGIYALAVGTVGGGLFEAVLLGRGLRRRGFYLLPRWHGLTPAVKQVARQYAPMAAGALLMSGTEVIDQSMAAMLGPGSVSALSYGNKVVSLIIGIGSLSLSTAIFPHFSRMVAANDWTGIRTTVKTYARLIILTTVPMTLFLVYLSHPIIALLFERGAFTAGDAHLVGRVQALYLLQAPFYFLGIMGVRLLSALKKNHVLMGISAANLLTNIVGNYVFMHFWGLPGISLSTSVVYFISMILIYLSLRSGLRTGA
ncbi:MAG: murein biosynthesis integral membrane protein MurJ [Deltaproteobacteria bacterium]|nr:murein biosynthesis integral membrane protein MurJ [Deltaproteobacteria bacterium]